MVNGFRYSIFKMWEINGRWLLISGEWKSGEGNIKLKLGNIFSILKKKKMGGLSIK